MTQQYGSAVAAYEQYNKCIGIMRALDRMLRTWCSVGYPVYSRGAGAAWHIAHIENEIAIAALQHYMTSDSYAHMLNRPVISLPWPVNGPRR